MSLRFAEKEEKQDHSPQTQGSSLHSFLFFFPQYWFAAGRLMGDQDYPWCGGTIWNSSETAHDNGSRGSHSRLEPGQLWRGHCSVWKSLHRSASIGNCHSEVPGSVAVPRPNMSFCRYSSKDHCLRMKGIPGAPHPKPSFEHWWSLLVKGNKEKKQCVVTWKSFSR